MKRSRASRRTLTAAAVVALVAFAVAVVAFILLAMQGSGPVKDSSAFIPFFAFGACCVVVLLCSVVFYEDLKKQDLPPNEELNLKRIYGVLPPAAITLYWWRYVRDSEDRDSAA